MSIATDATDPPPLAADGPTSAAQLAARIEIPTRLPVRAYDGERLRHLSASSYNLWLLCRESWRRKYICGYRSAKTGAMFLGSRVDDAVSLYYQRILEHDERLDLAQVKDAYRDLWQQQQLAAEQDKLGVDWSDIHQQAAFEMGLDALALTFEQLIPKLGEPVAVQRRLEYTLGPVEWTILCYLDLETRGHGLTDQIRRIVDYKVKNSTISQPQADRDPQASLYLAGRWLQGDPAGEFTFAQIGKRGPRRKQMSSALVTTTRTAGQMRASLARIALAASEISATYERLGPGRPWGLADPASWKCSTRFCEHFQTCPGGAGL